MEEQFSSFVTETGMKRRKELVHKMYLEFEESFDRNCSQWTTEDTSCCWRKKKSVVVLNQKLTKRWRKPSKPQQSAERSGQWTEASSCTSAYVRHVAQP